MDEPTRFSDADFKAFFAYATREIALDVALRDYERDLGHRTAYRVHVQWARRQNLMLLFSSTTGA